MAGLSVVSAPSFANTFGPPNPNQSANQSYGSGAVPGVAQASNSFGGGLQGSGQFNNATVLAPTQPATSQSLGDVSAPNFGTTLTATKTAGPGSSSAYRQVYNGQVYTDPNQLAQAQAADQRFNPIDYNGKTYNDSTSYANAVIGDVKTNHDQAIKQITDAHASGLINFDQRQKLLDQNRTSLATQLQNTLDSQSSHFASADANGLSSRQGQVANDTNKANDQAVGGLNTEQQAIGTDRSAYEGNYANSIAAADKGQQAGIDSANNAARSSQNALALSKQGILDSGQNAATSFAASQPKGNSSSTNYDPATLTQGIASYFVNANAAGLTPDQQKAAVTTQLTNQGLSAADIAPYVNYAYGQVSDPSTSYGKAYSAKSPLSTPTL